MFKFFKVLGIILGVVLVILIAGVFFVRSPWGQEIIVGKAVSFVKEKTGTEIQIGRLFVTFGGNIFLEDLYLEDEAQDTLLYSQKLEAGLALMPLITTGDIHVTKLDWQGLTARVSRPESSGKFNFDFLLEAFASDSTQAAPVDTVASDPITISIAPASFRDFDLVYDDEVMGIDAALRLGVLDVDISEIDLEKFFFSIDQIVLKNTTGHYHQSKPFPPSEEEDSTSPLPRVELDELLLSGIDLDYQSEPDRMQALAKIGLLIVELPEASLQDQIVHLAKIHLAGSSLSYSDFSEKAEPVEEPSADSAAFAWPDWVVEADQIRIDSTDLTYQTADVAVKKGQFNPELISISGLTLDAGDILLEDRKVAAELREFRFVEGSGFELSQFQFDLALDDETIEIDDLILETNRSYLAASTRLDYASIKELISAPERSQIELEIADTRLDVRDAYFFSPELAQDTLIRELAKAPILLDAELEGDLENLDIASLGIAWSETRLQAEGTVRYPMDMEQLRMDLPEIRMASTRADLTRFVDEKALGIQLPETLSLQSSVEGALDELLAELDLETSLGNIALKGAFQNQQTLAFDADLEVKALQLGTLLQMPELDTASFRIKASGAGTDIYSLNAELSSSFERLRLYGGDYSGLNLEGKLVNGAGDVHLWIKEEFIDFDLLTQLDLDSAKSKIDLNLNLEGADFRELGLTGENSRAKLKLQANFEGNPEAFDLSAHLGDGNVFFKDRNYQTGTLDLAAHLRPDSTSLDIDSKIINGYLRSNSSTAALQTALSDLFTHYLDSTAQRNYQGDSLRMNIDLRIAPDPILTDVLLTGLESFDSARVKVDFVQASDSLVAAIDFPYLNYGGTEIDELHVQINGDRNELDLAMGFQGLTTGPVAMQKTELTGILDNSLLKLDFITHYQDEVLAQIPFEIGISGDSTQIHISPENLKLNGEAWDIPSDNSVTYSTGNLQFRDFELSKQGQSLVIENDIPGFTEKNIAVEFNDFRMETFTEMLNPSDSLAAGALRGELVVENPFGATGLMGKLTINELVVMATPLGTLDLEATAKSLGNYVLALTLQDRGVDLGLEGSFVADEAGANIDLDLDLRRIDLEKIASLSQGQLTDGQGYLSGKVSVGGTTTAPIYEGEFQFNEASFVPTQLSTKYVLSDETLRVDNDGVYLDQFTIRDGDGNTFAVDGTVYTEDLTNPSFDLQLDAENFLAINSTNEENELVFGKASLDADVSIQGDLALPIVRANLRVRDNTDLTVIIPESELDLVEREGVVNFVNRSDPNDILTRPLDETTSSFAGYEIHAALAVDPEANFKVVIDPSTGDNLTIAGESELRMDINPNGRITLTGAYEVNGGFYEMSLYNLISKKFDINPGSRITWNGDPMDATLDLRAIYAVETSAADLMSSQLSGSDSETISQYQQRLSFLVYLNVKGELLRPEITFALDMPESERGAFGGNVYSRVLQVNGQEDELNKQVFSLLVLDRFFPSTGSDGSSGGAEAIARNSASQLLSSQMNALSSKIFGENSGFSVGFDVDSYQDYQSGSAQNRTDLNINAQQRLFDDRLIVEVGSQVGLEGNSSQSQEQEANALLANISFEYLLTEDGRWRIRVFRKNQFESIIDGQLFVTGIGLILNREFNEFSELWRPPVKEEEEEVLTKKEKRKRKKAAKKTNRKNEDPDQ
ncbi:translocation/assembly module TamB domain-containing protein [Algoriphagus oliviformis]|uniref:translocation/assembly module TamB domain-containing protein n=1 Tax=Algoriphagus oliviformis TaxID=2811231 RepID=UPI001F378C2F|nr:translocation/assembly module TamB [Algoriphagus oliviformis]